MVESALIYISCGCLSSIVINIYSWYTQEISYLEIIDI